MSALSACAFDSSAWLAKRAVHARNAFAMRAVYTNLLSRVDAPADKVSVPVEQHSDGSVKILLEADRMQYFSDAGLIYAEGVVIKKFNEKGAEISVIKAKTCAVDRVRKRGWAQGRVDARQDRTTMRGNSAYFSSPDDYIQVFGNVYLKSLDLKFGGMR